ncbi:MAG: hypothetical protein V3V87_02630 [Methylobacterium ajmalii]
MTTISSGRQERPLIDMPRFVADLCAAMGGDKPQNNDHRNNNTWTFALGENRIVVYARWHEARVTARIEPTGIPEDDLAAVRRFKTSEASFDPDARDIARIAADVKRRVVEASAEALANQRAEVVQRAEQRRAVNALAVDLESRGFEVQRLDGGTELCFHHKDSASLSGRTQRSFVGEVWSHLVLIDPIRVDYSRALAILDLVREA